MQVQNSFAFILAHFIYKNLNLINKNHTQKELVLGKVFITKEKHYIKNPKEYFPH